MIRRGFRIRIYTQGYVYVSVMKCKKCKDRASQPLDLMKSVFFKRKKKDREDHRLQITQLILRSLPKVTKMVGKVGPDLLLFRLILHSPAIHTINKLKALVTWLSVPTSLQSEWLDRRLQKIIQKCAGGGNAGICGRRVTLGLHSVSSV